MLLEERAHALARGAKIYCEVTGYGMSSDAYHISSPSEDGGGMIRVMQRALKDASLAPKDIDYINAHGTSTAVGDRTETMAIKHGVMPPTMNYETPDPECDLDYVPNKARQKKLRHVMSNSFGFGGTNATLIFSAHE